MTNPKSPSIRHRTLDVTDHQWHKIGHEPDNFGMNNTKNLLEGGFGLYSSANTLPYIGPAKTNFYRIAMVRSGKAAYTIGADQYTLSRNTIVFGYPGQVVSFRMLTKDFFGYYMLFSERFIDPTLLTEGNRNQFPFLSYVGVPVFDLEESESNEIESIILKINGEIKARKQNTRQAIQLYLQLILVTANRTYEQLYASTSQGKAEAILFNQYTKLVTEHFLSVHQVSEYARMLHVSPDHLNRVVKSHSQVTAHEWIDSILLRETKALLMYTTLSISEIAYKLGFSCPSYFCKFFKKHAGSTPIQFRQTSD